MTEAPRPIAGLHRATTKRGDCGLCGEHKMLTRTHIPPRSAFNSRGVQRQYLVSKGHGLTPGRPSDGGLWVMGLCSSCNELGGRYDTAYRDLAHKLRTSWVKDWHFSMSLRPIPQLFTLKPGDVARSVLIGMFGLNPNLRVTQPSLAENLLRIEAFELPNGRELRLALFRGSMARISGAIGAFDALGPGHLGKRLGIMSDAQIYFPPLSWELVDSASMLRSGSDLTSILDAYGWADVSSWTTRPPGEMQPLHSFFTTLPAVAHPKYMPATSEGWVELLSNQISEILVSDLSRLKRL